MGYRRKYMAPRVYRKFRYGYKKTYKKRYPYRSTQRFNKYKYKARRPYYAKPKVRTLRTVRREPKENVWIRNKQRVSFTFNVSKEAGSEGEMTPQFFDAGTAGLWADPNADSVLRANFDSYTVKKLKRLHLYMTDVTAGLLIGGTSNPVKDAPTFKMKFGYYTTAYEALSGTEIPNQKEIASKGRSMVLGSNTIKYHSISNTYPKGRGVYTGDMSDFESKSIYTIMDEVLSVDLTGNADNPINMNCWFCPTNQPFGGGLGTPPQVEQQVHVEGYLTLASKWELCGSNIQ